MGSKKMQSQMFTKKILFQKLMPAAMMMGTFMLLSSCSSKDDSIRELETLSADMILHSTNYTEEEWTEALEKYQELTEDLQGEDLTPEQLQRLGKVKGEISGYITNQAAREAGAALRDALNEAAGFVDGFVNTAIPDVRNSQKK